MNVNDLTSLLWILAMSRQSGVVLAELLEMKEAQTNESWQANLYLIEGKTIACHLFSNADGRMFLANDEAMQWLKRWGQHEFVWNLKAFTPQETHALLHSHNSLAAPLPPPRLPQQSLPPPKLPQQPLPSPKLLQQPLPTPRFLQQPLTPPESLPPPAKDRTIPLRLVEVEPHELNSWPRNHRRVFVLVDGSRNTDKIAAILKLPPTAVEEILHDLRKAGILQR